MGGVPMLYGVDVHDGYQAGLSFPLLRQQGYTFATVKLTQGTGYVRDLADDWIRAAGAAGLIPGAYHWLDSSDGAAQARWFHRHVMAAGGPRGMLIQLDAEDNGYGPQMRAWAGEWARLSGGHPFLIYSGGWWWNSPDRPMRTVQGAALTPYLWHSHYLTADTDSVPDDPAAFASRIPADWWTPGYGGWPTATILQFTSKGDAGNLANKVDLNVTRLTREQLLALTRPAGTTPTGDGMASFTDEDGRYMVGRTFCAANMVDQVTTSQGEVIVHQGVIALKALIATVAAIAAKVDIDPAELAAIGQAAGAGVAAQIPALVEALMTRLPADTLSRDEMAQVVRDALAPGFVLAPDAAS